MKKKDVYEQYWSKHYSHFDGETLESGRTREYVSLKNTLGKLFRSLDKNTKILDLGCGYGKFAHTCKQFGLTNFTGIDISTEQIGMCKRDFPKYTFKKTDIVKFLKTNKQKYDLIYMSHTFEHFTLDEGVAILKLIKKTLAKGGMFINIMPNADAYFHSCATLYADITHERLYTSSSFSELLAVLGFENFTHMNFYIGKNIFAHALHKFALFFFELYIMLLGYNKNKVYTSSIITIVRN